MFAIMLNGLATTVGAMLGLILKKTVSRKQTLALFSAIGLCVTSMGMQNVLKTESLLLLLISITMGTIAGTAIKIEDTMRCFGKKVMNIVYSSSDQSIVKGFLSLSIMQIIGAMAILGPIEAAFGDTSLLYFKSVLDVTVAFIFGSIYGLGTVLAGIIVILYEAFFYVLAGVVLPLMTNDVVRELNAVGGIMIVALGLNMLGITKLKVADFLPAICVPILYYYIISII
jgi:uncharacterized membrane protein YqgA involved in biofilm formation